jgi:ankyrin repeat protein
MNLLVSDPLAIATTSAIHTGETTELSRLLRENPGLATAAIVDAKNISRSMLHIVADWPGHFPHGAESVAALIAAGADPNAIRIGPQARETPLHWAASSDDVAVLDALLDGGANIEAPGAVFTGGPAMSDAVIFANWRAARRRSASTTIWQAAALGLLDRVKNYCAANPPPSPHDLTSSFWHACRGGQRHTAEFLLAQGADVNWIGFDKLTALGAAQKSGNQGFIAWLRSQGAKLTEDLD